MIFGSISPSADCSKYPIILDPTTNINKIARMPKVDLKTSIFKKYIIEIELKSQTMRLYKNYELIEEYLIKNQILDLNPKLTKYLIDQYL